MLHDRRSVGLTSPVPFRRDEAFRGRPPTMCPEGSRLTDVEKFKGEHIRQAACDLLGAARL